MGEVLKLALIDTAYPDFLKGLPPLTGSYDEELAKYLDLGFGTFDAYSCNLRELGLECVDIVANHRPLQELWKREYIKHKSGDLTALEQIEYYDPDVVFMQDLSFFVAGELSEIADDRLLAGQCSCPMPRTENISKFDVLFTSFPHYIDKFKALGVRAEYLPLAFDPRMLSEPQKRDVDISFVGGVGKQSHWYQGTNALEAVAAKFPAQFQWFGYGNDNLAVDSPLRKCWRGFKWGRDMYAVYQRSKIGITRHGEVAQGFTNNLRCYEIAGSGAMLMTEASPNLGELFPGNTAVSYASAGELIEKIQYYLDHDAERIGIAQAGQDHVLANHTYSIRMKRVSEVLTECLQGKYVNASSS